MCGALIGHPRSLMHGKKAAVSHSSASRESPSETAETAAFSSANLRANRLAVLIFAAIAFTWSTDERYVDRSMELSSSTSGSAFIANAVDSFSAGLSPSLAFSGVLAALQHYQRTFNSASVTTTRPCPAFVCSAALCRRSLKRTVQIRPVLARPLSCSRCGDTHLTVAQREAWMRVMRLDRVLGCVCIHNWDSNEDNGLAELRMLHPSKPYGRRLISI